MWEENLLSRYNCNVYIVYTDDWIINVIDVKKEILRFFRTFLHTFYVSLFHNFIVLSFSSAADAIIFSVGWHAVHKTVSVCPCKRCTMSLLCKFQMYTKLSSLPDTIHCRRKQNVIKMLHVAKSSFFLSILPCRRLRKNWRKCSISHFCGRYMFSSIFPLNSPIISMCYLVWRPKYICRSAKT